MCVCVYVFIQGDNIYLKELDHEAIEAWQTQSVMEWLTEWV